jgi:hypothetical protein
MHTDNEPPMKNLAGNEAMLFLFRFECRESGISFVLNGVPRRNRRNFR